MLQTKKVALNVYGSESHSVKGYLKSLGIQPNNTLSINPSYKRLHEDEICESTDINEQGIITDSGAMAIKTGAFTGRSPKDKYIVLDDKTKDTIWWRSKKNGNDNKPITKDVWKILKDLSLKQLSDGKLYIVDAICGADRNYCMRVRFIVQVAWQAHFIKNMFIEPTKEELEDFEPDFTVLNASRTTNPYWEEQGLHSENFVAFNLSERTQLIGGTWYGGEMKKGMFSIMNYYLPRKGIASMHSAANQNKQGEVALFFGLSGTGKTTLSTDANRALIGDDEHGWSKDGVFNFEGGCYAKTLDLDPKKEPEIFNAITHNALLENVPLNENKQPKFSCRSITENGRVSYPLKHIKNRVKPISQSGHANKILFLTADAFGVLPPVSKLSPEQAQYYYLSGFTAKLAGTELGISQPTPTFSACFGQAFLSLHPTKYAQVLHERMEESKAQAYLVNTGWNGTGKRFDLSFTRSIVNAILNDQLEEGSLTIPYFNLLIPNAAPGIHSKQFDPRNTHPSYMEWEKKAQELAKLFIQNFDKFSDTSEGESLVQYGPKAKM